MNGNLRKIARLTGFAVLAISIYFSYDGFDQSVSGENPGYSGLAVLIGFTLAIVVSVMQFIFGTNFKDLNWTLRIAGIAAYVYSIYTNYLGVKHVLGADEFMAWASAFFMDIYPEPAIAWSLGESLTGDLFGNIGKILFGDDKPQKYVPKHKPDHTGKHRVFSDQKLASPIFNQKYTEKFKPGFKGFKPDNYE